jgi:hypothetical protein
MVSTGESIMNKQVFSKISIGTIIVLIASAVTVASFFLEWTSIVLASGGGVGTVLFTNSGFEVAREGISDKYSSLSWIYFLTPVMALSCFVIGALSLKHRSSRLHILQIILSVGFSPFALMAIEFKYSESIARMVEPSHQCSSLRYLAKHIGLMWHHGRFDVEPSSGKVICIFNAPNTRLHLTPLRCASRRR